MKQHNFKTLLIVLFLAGLTACSNQKKLETKSTATFLPLKERNKALAEAADWASIKSKATALFQNIKSDSMDLKSKLLLAQLYMQEARITGEHPYYYPATLTILDDVLRHEPSNFEALAFKSSVLLSLHHFKEALEVGYQAKSINSNNGFIYGVLCDANVELGNYAEAVKMSDQMQTLRPGLESYSRASYLREIYGDNAGAIAAMKLAFEAGLAGSEEASWAGNTLAQLYLNTGDLKNAELLSQMILEQRNSYAFSVNTLGEIQLAKGNYAKAIEFFDQAVKIMPEYSFYENKAKTYQAMGEVKKAESLYRETLTMLAEDAESGHYVDMDLAKVYLQLNDVENALKYARIEYNRRPLNKDANHTIAMVMHKKGDYAAAKTYMDVAMRLGTQNAELLTDAAQIEMSLGNKEQGVSMLSKAKKINTFSNSKIDSKS
jgi:tetratricopeptide (TPR) repeat protein